MDTTLIVCAGVAAVIDTVLLLALLERRNRRRVFLPVSLLTLGVWLWHVGDFGGRLLAEMKGPWASDVRLACSLAAAAGLLVIPGALLHLAARLRRFDETFDGFHPARAAAYWPILLLIPLARRIVGDASGLAAIPRSWTAAYTIYLVLAGVPCALEFFRLRAEAADQARGAFGRSMGFALLFATGGAVLLQAVAAPLFPQAASAIEISTLLLPAPLAVLFAAFIIHHNVFQLVIERTLVYGAVLFGILLFHRFTVSEWTAAIEERYRIDCGLIECIAVFAIVLAYQPLRQRAAEGLRYLLGTRVAPERDRLREISIQLSGLAGQPTEDVLAWFADGIRAVLGLSHAVSWTIDARGEPVRTPGAPPPAPPAGPTASPAAAPVGLLHAAMGELRAATRFDAPSREIADALTAADASAALKVPDAGAPTVILLGRRAGNRAYSEEEMNALMLLTEQLGATLRASRLLAERLTAERRALQAEKLSALGLLASLIAHEVKNPLSSIKTIAAVLAEDLGADSRHGRDLKLITGEVDRLAATTSQLLEFAGPSHPDAAPMGLDQVVERVLAVLRLLAKQRDVALEFHAPGPMPPVAGDAASLKEIVFNLVTNGIDAAACRDGAPERRVEVHLGVENGSVTMDVRDSGGGIPVEVQDRIFEPFFTTKEAGTGLGLYIVARRVRELHGEVHCESSPGRGTRFSVKLPLRREP